MSHDPPPTRTFAREPDSTSSSLLDRVKSHDSEAWQRLVELYGPVVYVWGRQAGLQASDATDMVQEVFVAVWRNIDRFRRAEPGDSFRGWLWSIARNKIRDVYRRRQGQTQAAGGTTAQRLLAELSAEPTSDSINGPGSELGTGLFRRALELVRAEFEASTWQAFWRTAIDGRAPADVAEELGMTRQAVYKAKSRVLRRVRHDLEGLGPDGPPNQGPWP